MRISVHAWAPEYGAEVDQSSPEAVSVEDVDTTCESRSWEAVRPSAGLPDGVVEVAFVDGTRRTDAAVFVTPDGAPAAKPGVAGSVGVGAVFCDLPEGLTNGEPRRPAWIAAAEIQRFLAVGLGGQDGASLLCGAGLDYRALSSPGSTLDEITGTMHEAMRRSEADLAISLSRDDNLVFIDGPLARMSPGPRRVIGVIKSHGARYLPEDHELLLGELDLGERTPMFCFGAPHRPRYSWYLRLCERDPHMHAWHGLVRCEVPAELAATQAAALANSSASLLPSFASEPHWDKRAPQNLVPIAGLERHLRHMMGERELVYRMIRDAAARQQEGVGGNQ